MKLAIECAFMTTQMSGGGSGFVAGILENGALVSVNHGVHKGIYYVYFDELEKMD